MPRPPLAKVISAAIKSELLRRGIKHAELARMVGTDVRHLSNVISGYRSSRSLGLRIEAALDCAYWSDSAAFVVRRPLRERFGIDPAALSLRQLDALVAKHLPGAGIIRPRPVLLARLESLAANPTNATSPIP